MQSDERISSICSKCRLVFISNWKRISIAKMNHSESIIAQNYNKRLGLLKLVAHSVGTGYSQTAWNKKGDPSVGFLTMARCGILVDSAFVLNNLSSNTRAICVSVWQWPIAWELKCGVSGQVFECGSISVWYNLAFCAGLPRDEQMERRIILNNWTWKLGCALFTPFRGRPSPLWFVMFWAYVHLWSTPEHARSQ